MSDTVENQVQVTTLKEGRTNKNNYIKIGLNALLCISFFLPWIKASKEFGYFLGMFNLGEMNNYLKLSPYKLLDIVRMLSKYSDQSIGELAIAYGYLLIPILSILSACAVLFIKSKSKVINVASSLIIFLIALMTYVKLVSIEESELFMGFSYGYFLVVIGSLANIVLNLMGQENLVLKTTGEDDKSVKDQLNESEFVNFIKADFSKKDKAHKTLLAYGIIVALALIVSIIDNIKGDSNILSDILAISLPVLIFYMAYFKLNFKINELQNREIMSLSDSLYHATNYFKRIDEHLVLAIIGAIVSKFALSHLISAYDFHAVKSMIVLLLNFAIIALFIRAFGLKHFKGLRYGCIGLGIIYGLMIFRSAGHSQYWADYDALFMLGLAWIGYIFIKSNYED